MKQIQIPRFIEPFAAALMGAGFFIFTASLSGGPFWRSCEESLWSHFKGHPDVAPAEVIWIEGGTELDALSVAQRRLALARDIDLLSSAGVNEVVLEAWLDEPSQIESEEILADLLDSAQSMPKKSLRSLQAKVENLQTHLNADDTLAASMRRAGNVVLPAEVEEASGAAPLEGSVWEKFKPYDVSLRGKGVQHLDASWRLVRAPIELFRDAAEGMALVAPPMNVLPDQSLEVSGIFQLRGKWVNGLGFDAARRALEVPSRGQHFLWRQGRLRAVELRGAQYPMNGRGGFLLPPEQNRAVLEAKVASSLDDPALLSQLKGKIIFYQPWPSQLVGEGGFQNQRDLCAGILAQRLQLQQDPGSEFWVWAAFWLALTAGVAWMALPWGTFLGLASAAALILRFVELQASLARPLGMLASAMLCGWGAGLILRKRRNEVRRLWLRGHVAPRSQEIWEGLIADPASGSLVEGVYVVAASSEAIRVKDWEEWAARWDVFCEVLDASTVGFFLPLKARAPYPLAPIQELRKLLPGVKMSSSRGALGLAAEKAFDSVRWSLSGRVKEGALKLLSMARPGAYFISEEDYALVRQNVKIQLISESELTLGAGVRKIFNVLEVF